MTELTDPADGAGDHDALRAELDRLRRRTAELERERAGVRRAARAAWLSQARAALSAVLIVVGVICVSTAPEATWGRNLVLDTDHYVHTLQPVACDPGVQAAVIRLVDRQIDTHPDVTGLARQVLPERAGRLVGPVLQSAVAGLVNTVTTRLVRSSAFGKLWALVNRVAHQQVVYLLTGKRPANAAITLTSGDKVLLDLAPIVSDVKRQLVNTELGIARSIPAVSVKLEIAELGLIAGGLWAAEVSVNRPRSMSTCRQTGPHRPMLRRRARCRRTGRSAAGRSGCRRQRVPRLQVWRSRP